MINTDDLDIPDIEKTDPEEFIKMCITVTHITLHKPPHRSDANEIVLAIVTRLAKLSAEYYVKYANEAFSTASQRRQIIELGGEIARLKAVIGWSS